MSNENTTPGAITLKKDVRAEVENRDKQGGEGSVRSIVVTALADAEIARRTQVLRAALDKRDTLDMEIKGIKPSLSQGVNPETGKEEKRFSKADFDKKGKLEQKLGKLDAAIDAVLESPSAENYGKLKDQTAKS